MLLGEAKRILGEAGVSVAEYEGALALVIEEGGKEVVVYITADDGNGLVYVMASSNPPIELGGSATEFLRASWEIVDTGIPCKISLNEGIVLVELDLDLCHLNRESLLESIYYVAESMFRLIDKFGVGTGGRGSI